MTTTTLFDALTIFEESFWGARNKKITKIYVNNLRGYNATLYSIYAHARMHARARLHSSNLHISGRARELRESFLHGFAHDHGNFFAAFRARAKHGVDGGQGQLAATDVVGNDSLQAV